MQIEKRLKNHYKRWSIVFNYEEEFLKFKNRLIEILNKLIGEYLAENSDIDERFKEVFDLHKADKPYVKKSQPIYKNGNPLNPLSSLPNGITKSFMPDSYTKNEFGDTYVYKCICDCDTLQELATVLQIFFWTLEAKYDEIKDVVSEILKEIKRISILTPSASFVVHQRGKQFIVYPNGDHFLDRGIIDCTLSGLEDYPEVAKHFEQALGICLRGERNEYRNLLDNLRFALEQLLKKILSNEKSLENQKSNLGSWLKEKGLHSQVIRLYQTLLTQYQNYQNNAVKHNENYSFNEVEFMIYLTGNFMRLLIQLANQTSNIK
ncbi:MAG: hypothetical protein QNJ70_31095 [Xenococcaceae cyanobacterium MO_207.B15]|nr:hypothetical protein [Xenococcaceae cyanobacterium MO_207.B15]